MENFLDSVFPFLIITVVVVSRVALAIGRQKRGRQGKKPAPTAAPKPARGFVPWEDEFREGAPAEDRPAQTAPVDEDEAFSAWDLSVNDEPPAPAAPSAPASPSGPPEAPAPFAAASARFAVEERLAAVPDRVAAVPERVAPAPALPRPAPKSAARRFRSLSPLQRAVVWAEILGAPKGF
jgi:hypothetical protein